MKGFICDEGAGAGSSNQPSNHKHEWRGQHSQYGHLPRLQIRTDKTREYHAHESFFMARD
jgi:hypothetical protein